MSKVEWLRANGSGANGQSGLKFNDKSIARETTQDWNVNVSYAADGTIVEMVILDAVKAGLIPFHSGDERKAA